MLTSTYFQREARTHFDCLIIGAGICGIDAAYYLQKNCPWVTYAILEGRANIGGTWDAFQYPGDFILSGI